MHGAPSPLRRPSQARPERRDFDLVSSAADVLSSVSCTFLVFLMFIFRRSSDFSLVSLRKPHDNDGRAESASLYTDDDSYRLLGPPTQDRVVGVDGPGDNSDRVSGRFQLQEKARQPARSFERPRWRHLCLHVFLCVASYPVIYAGTLLARNRSLFWARVIVGLWCAAVGVVIGWSLLAYASRFLEAASGY